MSSISNNTQPHFVLIPLMAQGHMIPMIDMAKIFAECGVLVSLITTPNNALRFQAFISRASSFSNLPIKLVQIPFPSEQVGLPIGFENLDSLPSRTLLRKFFNALNLLQNPLEQYLQNQNPLPTCIISDKSLSWTSETAQKFKIPRLVFHGMCCFSLFSSHNIKLFNAHNSVNSDSEPFLIPGLSQKIEITKAQLPGAFVTQPDLDDLRDKNQEAEYSSYGIVINSFEELETEFVEKYQKVLNKKIWCIGPVSLCNKNDLDKSERGNKASMEDTKCIEWLNSKKQRSVIYACLGSQCRLVSSQLIEIGLGLEASKKPFIWVIKNGDERFNSEFEKWLLEEKFEERIKGKGILIKGWAPQVLILSHKAIGGFLTHCGWNSTIEGLCFGIPMITWPLFAEQFLNEKLIVEILKIGVRVGVEVPVRWGEEEKVGVLVKRDGVMKAVEILMDLGEDGENRRKRAFEFGKMARKATENGGSSYSNVTCLINDVELQSAFQEKQDFDDSL